MNATDTYWQQYLWAKPEADAEDMLNPFPKIAYEQYLPADPQHPRAFIPNYVRYAKRKELGFKCAVTGWSETDYFQDVTGHGPIRLVGRLTADHIIPGASGGLTTDDNIQMVSEFANTKKGSKLISNEELKERLLEHHQRIELPEDVLAVLRKYNIVYYRMGNGGTRHRFRYKL